jgi:hypothetical protein
MEFLKRINFSDGYSPAFLLIIIVLTIGVTFLLYGIFDSHITSVFPGMVIDNSGDPALAEFAITWWKQYLIVAFVTSMIIFVIVNSQRDDQG